MMEKWQICLKMKVSVYESAIYFKTQITDQNYFKKRLKSYLSYTGRITSINLVQPAMDEENIGNPVDTGWSWVILFGSPSLVFLQSFFLKVITLEMTILREIYSILITF